MSSSKVLGPERTASDSSVSSFCFPASEREAKRARQGSAETEGNSASKVRWLSRRLRRRKKREKKNGKKRPSHRQKNFFVVVRRSEPSLSLSLSFVSPRTERSSERGKPAQRPCRRTRARAGRTVGEVRSNEGAPSPDSRWRAPHRSTPLGTCLHGARGTRAPLSELLAHSRSRRTCFSSVTRRQRGRPPQGAPGRRGEKAVIETSKRERGGGGGRRKRGGRRATTPGGKPRPVSCRLGLCLPPLAADRVASSAPLASRPRLLLCSRWLHIFPSVVQLNETTPET